MQALDSLNHRFGRFDLRRSARDISPNQISFFLRAHRCKWAITPPYPG